MFTFKDEFQWKIVGSHEELIFTQTFLFKYYIKLLVKSESLRTNEWEWRCDIPVPVFVCLIIWFLSLKVSLKEYSTEVLIRFTYDVNECIFCFAFKQFRHKF